MTDQNHDTKTKILEVARVLFADQGFEGTSVREIAKAADVNIASVNYHFTNKENLFKELRQKSYLECSQEIRAYYDRENPKLEDILIHVFRYFNLKSHDLVTFFKIIISSQHNHMMTCSGCSSEEETFGPPGGLVIAEAIKKEVGREVSEEDLFWAVRCLFTHIIHNSIMMKCWFKLNNHPYSNEADLEKSIRRLSRIVLEDLKQK
jgi:AcrR family transcriptional regulator